MGCCGNIYVSISNARVNPSDDDWQASSVKRIDRRLFLASLPAVARSSCDQIRDHVK